MSLDKTVSLFDNMVGRQLQVKVLDWPELGRFLKALRDLQIATNAVRPPMSVERVLRTSRIAKRVLMGSPVHPDSCLPAQVELDAVRNEVAGSSLSDSIEELCESVRQLAPTLNPAAEKTVDVITQDSGISVGDKVLPGVLLIVPAEARLHTSNWLDAMELEAKVVTATEAKALSVWPRGVMYGLPDNYVWSHDFSQRSEDAAWLISAAPARHLDVLIGPGNVGFKSKKYEPWPGTDVFAVEASAPAMFVDLVRDQTAEWIPSVPKVRSRDSGRAAIETQAVPVALGGGGWVFFDRAGSLGLQPRVITADATGIHLQSVKTTELAEGHVLVIPTSRADRQFLRQTAQVWLQRKYGETCDFFEQVEGFKSAVQEFSLEPNSYEQLLAQRMEKGMARRWLQAIWVDESIAPANSKDVAALCQAAAHPYSRALQTAIEKLRAAMRQAGEIAQRELRARLNDSTDWQEIVSSGRGYSVEIATVGSILVAPVASVLSLEQEVPIGSLGRFIDDDGEEVEVQ